MGASRTFDVALPRPFDNPGRPWRGKLRMPTAAAVMLQTLAELGVSYVCANVGSDHPAILEALAEARAKGWKAPSVITCPNEMVALSAAHGHALVSGRAQAVLVHVDCGTQALGGAVHNAARARVP